MFIFDPDKRYTMPPYFGGWTVDPNLESHVKDALTINFIQITDGELLANYLPEGFQLVRPELAVQFAQFRQVEFLAGGAYNAVLIAVPVSFQGERDHLDGILPLVVWESNTRAIIGGREETGIPKIYADQEDFHIFQNKYFTSVSFEGNTFLRMEMNVTESLNSWAMEQLRAENAVINNFGWRYIPKVGVPGAELSQPVLYPQGFRIQNAWTGNGFFQWTKLGWEQNESQAHIIDALASLPVKAMGPATMMQGEFIYKPNAGRVLE